MKIVSKTHFGIKSEKTTTKKPLTLFLKQVSILNLPNHYEIIHDVMS